MTCMLKGCSVNTNSKERLISCWICDNVSHLCCAGFNGRHYDVICDREKGLRWSCWDCRKLDIDYYKLFREAKSGVTEFKKTFKAMSEKLSKFEKLFENFDFSVCSPKRKKSSLTVNDNVRGNDNTVDKNLISLLSPVGDIMGPQPDNVHPETAVIQENSSACNGYVTAPILSHNSNVETVSSISPRCEVNRSDENSEPMSVNCTSVEPVPTNDLVVVPPRKTIFLSRLAPDTSIDHIRSYVKSKCAGMLDNDLSVYKFNFSQPRDIASFRLYIPARIFDILVDKSFWPEGTLVREFVHRERVRSNVATLPPRITVSKN